MIATASLTNMQSYIDAVTSGEIVACKFVKDSVARHVKDLGRQSTQDFPYHFSEKHAAAAIDFFPLMLNHSIGDYVGQPFHMEPWQAWITGCMFGWKRDCDGARRFRQAYVSVGRKNGKSTWAAGIAIRFAALDINPSTQGIESVAEVILSATKREQAQVIYKEIERMRHRSPHIEQVSKTINKQITFTHNSGSIRTVGSDKSYDGLNPSLCVMDELHAWSPNRHQKFYDTMVTGSGSRLQPMKLVVTTAGDDKSLIWIEEYKHAKSVAAGDVQDDSLFAVHYEIDEEDDPLDESCWIKSNPNLHVSLKLDYLRQQAIPAKTSKIALNRFTRYHGNRLVSSVESAFDIEKWDKCAGELSDWQYAEATGGGCDLGGRNDLAAWAVVARFPVEGTENDETPTYRYEIRTQSYISEETSRDLSRQPFCEWIHTDLLKKSSYPVSDLSEDFIAACREYWVRDIAFDPAQAQQLSECLRRAGVPNAAFPQTTSYYHEPLSEFRQAIEEGRVTHDGNRLLRWCIGNAMAVQDRQDHWMLTKRDSSDKIDPVVAVIMALWRAMVAPGRYAGKNLYF